MRTRNFAKRSVEELTRLIARAAAGEFSSAADSACAPSELGRMIDRLVAGLPERDAEILSLRFGSSAREPTLAELAERFQMSRERVRQIVKKSVVAIQKQGSQRLRSCIEHADAACGLNPASFQEWVKKSCSGGRYPWPFYVRLLGVLKGDLPGARD